jgi:hypothetical protein
MHTSETRAMTIGVWMLAMIAVGRWADVTTLAGWTLLAVGGIVPPVLLLKFWRPPTPTLSESIHKARD